MTASDRAGPTARTASDRSGASARLGAGLLSREEAQALDAHGSKDAGILVPIFDHPERPGLIFTERRRDLRRHGGEISFPGGRPDPGEDLLACALREAREEIALDPAQVEVVGALPPVSTVVTGYKVSPFVGLIDGERHLVANPGEVERILELRIADLRAGFEMRRLVRRGVPFHTPTYRVGEDVVWGATARILQDLLARLDL